ncbi:MAG: heme exporter protein CcmD [Proteobacteria bacterium]|nr:heme exporter protein CcmD [Pseudomonadota bacterium]MCZ6892522.1 heme exporter protein CcmD [Gammaproteobacteria bacterium]
MGGYGAYVWSAYGISAVVLAGNVLLSRRAERALLARLAERFEEEDGANDA